MKIGLIGLGKMGSNMTKRLLKDDHDVVVYDQSPDAVHQLEEQGATGADSLKSLVEKLTPPRYIWMMIPSGDPVEQTIGDLIKIVDKDDVLIDGGNSDYKDTLRRAKLLKDHGIHYVDVGTSGGVWGLEQGYSMMIGGEEDVVNELEPVFKTLAPGPDKGWGYVGKNGAGHYVKMVHNGIEYGAMEAYAEGFAVLEHKEDFELDLHQVAEIWRYGSVIRSWLLDLIADALEKNPTLENIAAYVEDSGEGRWTVKQAIDEDVPVPVITLALMERLRSRQSSSFTDRLLSAMRNEFGGHAMKKEESE